MKITAHAVSGQEHAKYLMSTEIGTELMAHATEHQESAR